MSTSTNPKCPDPTPSTPSTTSTMSITTSSVTSPATKADSSPMPSASQVPESMTSSEISSAATSPPTSTTETPVRTRRTRKRRFKHLPRPAIAVKGLIQAATPEELQKAHATCLLILDWWLGKKSKLEVARALSIPELRVWQLSQQGLSGMIAGLLKQPRPRRRGAQKTLGDNTTPARGCDPENDPVVLKKTIHRLTQELQAANRVNAVLRQFPFAPKAPTPTEERRGAKQKSPRPTRTKPARARALPEAKTPSDRSPPAGASAPPR